MREKELSKPISGCHLWKANGSFFEEKHYHFFSEDLSATYGSSGQEELAFAAQIEPF